MKVEFCFSGAVLPVMKKIRRFCFISVLIVFIFPAFAEISFNGLAGAVGTLCSDPEKDNFDLQLKLQTFFAGQFNLSDNLMVRGEFTVKTSDLIEKSVFKEIDTKFQIDELSLTFRSSGFELTNYLSLFIGTYEPIGSDIFLRRYFGINPIASRLTESWLGTAGSVIYPLIGAGLGDVLHFSSQPIAIGFYAYVNHELNDSYVFNIDARIGMVYRYMKLDFSTGIGAPLNTKYYNDAFIVVNKLYWRAGINLLLGNPRNFSMYVQTGASEIPFSKNNKKISFSNVKTYILIEPRLNISALNFALAAYSLPSETVSSLLFIDDTLGTALNIYTDGFHINNQIFVFGVNTSFSFPEKKLTDLKDFPSFFPDNFNIGIAPYISTKVLNGNLNLMAKVNVMDIVRGKWFRGLGISLGYKTQF